VRVIWFAISYRENSSEGARKALTHTVFRVVFAVLAFQCPDSVCTDVSLNRGSDPIHAFAAGGCGGRGLVGGVLAGMGVPRALVLLYRIKQRHTFRVSCFEYHKANKRDKRGADIDDDLAVGGCGCRGLVGGVPPGLGVSRVVPTALLH
jgi:hypothetical protein